MFKNDQVEIQMSLLNQQKGLMQKFRAKMVTTTSVKPQSESSSSEEEELDHDMEIGIKK
jgi:hypothetical protein